MHDEMQATARTAVGALIANEPGFAVPAPMVEPLAELTRAALAGLAIWWSRNPDVPRSAVVQVAVNATWLGLEGCGEPDAWSPT